MKLKSEFVNAVKLFLLLILLFWSFTWNSPVDFDLSHPDEGIQKVSKDVSSGRNDINVFMTRHSVLVDSIRHESRKSTEPVSSAAFVIPPFNEWKEKEMTKYENGRPMKEEEESYHHKKLVRRKLNYASSKCGAKVLASNPEARYRASVLSEKADEYMLNPCRAKMWFVVELCDTVEATQFDLANYELYSSSPKEFSVFWSEVYPTTVWHLLGKFDAKDRRTMQTFDLDTKNLGKFIKVIIYNHHGKEHYCPLSMIRVLGYSMVQKFEDIETSENNPTTLDDHSAELSDKNVVFEKEKLPPKNTTEFSRVSGTNSSIISGKICTLFLMHCTNPPHMQRDDSCVAEEPVCRFIIEIMKKSSANCHDVFSNKAENPSKTYNSTCHRKRKGHVIASKESISGAENSVKLTYSDMLRFPEKVKCHETYKYGSLNSASKSKGTKGESLKTLEMDRTENNTKEVNASNERNFTKFVAVPLGSSVDGRCRCERQAKILKRGSPGDTVTKDSYLTAILEDEESIESAGLIHKESVLFRLTARIKASETDLNFINKYLQQLSQSYRQQMDDMKTMFNQTLKAISIASEKAKIVDKTQEKSIHDLEQKTKTLSIKIDFLMREHKDLLKKVVELHGFFLILELIVISTLFTIFLNIFHRKSKSIMKDPTKKEHFSWEAHATLRKKIDYEKEESSDYKEM